MKLQRRMQTYTFMLTVAGMLIFVLGITGLLPGQGDALRPGDNQGQVQPTPQKSEETVPGVPGKRPERPIDAPQGESRKIVEQPRPTIQPTMPIQKHFADTFLPSSVRNVTDPQDGLTKDGRVAVLEGFNAQVVYQFYKENKFLTVPNQPALTIYTYDKGGFGGPYNVFVANFGDQTWTQLGMDVSGTAAFNLPPTMSSAELVLIINRHAGATYIDAVEGVTQAGGAMQGTFTYLPEELIGLRGERLDCAEIERARLLLTNTRQGYQLAPLGEIEVKWLSPIQNVWKKEEFFVEADGEYEVYVSDSRGMESLIGRRSGPQGFDLPQDMIDATTVRIRNHNGNRPIMIYSILGRR